MEMVHNFDSFKKSEIRSMKKIVAVILTFVLVVGCSGEVKTTEAKINQTEQATIKSGDIIFQSTNSRQCEAIKLATHSNYSHVGIVFEIDGELMVYEAVQPVKVTALDSWVNRGEGGHYAVKRLKVADQLLVEPVLNDMVQIATRYLGKNYDIYFEWSDEKIYCSELVWKIYKEALGIEIGELRKLKDFDLSSDIVKTIMTERYGDAVPLDEEVISPEDMFNSNKLRLVVKK